MARLISGANVQNILTTGTAGDSYLYDFRPQPCDNYSSAEDQARWRREFEAEHPRRPPIQLGDSDAFVYYDVEGQYETRRRSHALHAYIYRNRLQACNGDPLHVAVVHAKEVLAEAEAKLEAVQERWEAADDRCEDFEFMCEVHERESDREKRAAHARWMHRRARIEDELREVEHAVGSASNVLEAAYARRNNVYTPTPQERQAQTLHDTLAHLEPKLAAAQARLAEILRVRMPGPDEPLGTMRALHWKRRIGRCEAAVTALQGPVLTARADLARILA